MSPTIDTFPPLLSRSNLAVSSRSINFTITSNEPCHLNCSAAPLPSLGLTYSPPASAFALGTALLSTHTLRLTGLTPGVIYNVTCRGRDTYGNQGGSVLITTARTVSAVAFVRRWLYVGPGAVDLVLQLSEPGMVWCLPQAASAASPASTSQVGERKCRVA
jgi:hypothetical protein